jgi:hypothetical protein
MSGSGVLRENDLERFSLINATSIQEDESVGSSFLLLLLPDLALTTFLGFAFRCLPDFILPRTDIIYREVSDSTTVQALACAACLISAVASEDTSPFFVACCSDGFDGVLFLGVSMDGVWG